MPTSPNSTPTATESLLLPATFLHPALISSHPPSLDNSCSNSAMPTPSPNVRFGSAQHHSNLPHELPSPHPTTLQQGWELLISLCLGHSRARISSANHTSRRTSAARSMLESVLPPNCTSPHLYPL